MTTQVLLDLGATTQADYERRLYRALIREAADILVAMAMDYDGCSVDPTEARAAIFQSAGLSPRLPAARSAA